MTDNDTTTETIWIVLGEGGEPQAAFTDRDDARELQEHWRNGTPPIYAEVTNAELYDGTPRTIEGDD